MNSHRLSMETLPPELILYIIPFFPLTSLIAARGVSTLWRHFAQMASLHWARKSLLDVYLASIRHPNFRSLRAVLHPHVRAFDREAYLDSLTSRGCVLPGLFELWVLEWPSNAVCFWAWPGLPSSLDVLHRNFCNGVNGLSARLSSMPIVRPLQVRTAPGEPNESRNALLLWGTRNYLGLILVWLVVGESRDNGLGTLVWTCRQGRNDVTPDRSRCEACSTAQGRGRCFGCAATHFPLQVICDVQDFPVSSFYDFITLLGMTEFDLVWTMNMFCEAIAF